MSFERERQSGLQRVLVEYAVVDGRLRGTVSIPDGRIMPFADTAELERCLELGPIRRLVLVDDPGARGGEDGLVALSPTERQIAKAALAGATNREIATELCYSVKSVEAYLTRVYRRLGIGGRSGLPVVADALEDLEPSAEHAELVAGGTTAATATNTAVVELLVIL